METEADKLRAHGKAAKEIKMSEKYEVELAALNAESCSPLPGPLSSQYAPDRFTTQPRQEIPPPSAALFQGDLF